MIEKEVLYLSVNGSDTSSTLEIVDILSKDALELVIAHDLRTIPEFIKVLSRRDNILSVFSISDYLVSLEDDYSLQSFERVLSYIQQRIQSISTQDIFFNWLTQFSISQIEIDKRPSQEIISKFELNIGDLLEEFNDWKEQYEQRRQLVNQSYIDYESRIDTLFQNQCSSKDITPFSIRKIRISVVIPYTHSLYYYFDTVKLTQGWVMAVYKDLVRTNSMDNISEDGYKGMLLERDQEKLFIYHEDFEQFLTLEYSKSNSTMLELTLDIQPFEDIDIVRRQIQSIMNVETTDTYKTLSVSGVLYLKNIIYDKLLLHDFIMNDVMASHYLYVNELEKASRFGENVTIHFENSITAILINSKNDTLPKPSALAYFRGNYVKVNITKASGSQNDLENVFRFQNILCAILKRFLSKYQDYQQLYIDIIPSMSFPVLMDVSAEEERDDVSNFADKYKNIYKKTGYKTSCRPKSRVPTIVTKDEAKTINPLKVIKFPKDDDDELGIPQEYLTCKDPEYAFPGITSLSGGTLFVPCCFNKNPRSSRAFLEYYKGEKAVEPKGTEHIKSEYQIIKTFGDVGKLPSAIQQFLVALMPDKLFYRVGTEDTPNTILHSLNYLKGGEKKTEKSLREELVIFFGQNVNVCKQENPSLTTEEIQRDLQDESGYLDPRKYIRLLETYFDVNIVLFVKSKKTEELDLLLPNHKNFYIRYKFEMNRPFVFLYEHWGTSPDRYTKRLHPVCEMVTSEGQGLYSFSQEMVDDLDTFYRSVFPLYPLQQNCPTLSSNLRYQTQIIDSWGKCRGFVCQLDVNQLIYIESVLPIPPIYIQNEDTNVVPSITVPTLELLTSKLPDMEIIRMVSFMNTKYILFRYSSHEWKTQIRSRSSEVFEPISFPFLSYSPTNANDRSSVIAKDRRMARIILDYTLYLYSKHVMDSFDFEMFFEKYTVIQPNYTYPKVVTEEMDGNPGIMSNDTLILQSDLVRKKLEFNLKYFLIYNYTILKKFKENKFLPNFWECPYDFTKWKEVFYLPVFERLMKRPTYLEIDHVMIDDLSKPNGYWYKKEQIPYSSHRNPYRYVKVTSKEEAIAITIFWRKYGYLPNLELEIPEDAPMVTVRSWDKEEEKWSPSMTEGSEDNNVFVVQNKREDVYVLLEIKN